ncbi:ABC transporter permease [Conexibacter sp. CPCC 206217]|uniref:ABC transporter permease n=1 Tax=Conexibacter sp. CPCC 206217 TaxID=3064574 RepID=UPI00271C1EB7|nr:ABC transporter permease subunit [Conexibacter sp. CPCC 206217]MDO8212506.1 ABC transporter permease subunit [Conexibacter sp. CPCC 206217]
MPATTAIPRSQQSAIERIEISLGTRIMRYKTVYITIVNLACFFVLWQLIAKAEIVNPLFLPSATETFDALWTGFSDGVIWPELKHSLINFLVGMAISIAIGVPVGLLMGVSRVVDTVLSPYVWAMTALPRVALIPLLLLILGFGNTMQLVIIVLSAVFPIIINCMAGVKTVEPSLLRAGRTFGASQPQMYLKIILPFTLPFVISGINQGIARGLVGMLIGELLGGGGEGLGYLLDRSADQFNSGLLYGTLLLLAVMSVGLVQFMRWLERRVAPWREVAR